MPAGGKADREWSDTSARAFTLGTFLEEHGTGDSVGVRLRRGAFAGRFYFQPKEVQVFPDERVPAIADWNSPDLSWCLKHLSFIQYYVCVPGIDFDYTIDG